MTEEYTEEAIFRFDRERGVIYIDSKENGRTIVRISQVNPESWDPSNPVRRQFDLAFPNHKWAGKRVRIDKGRGRGKEGLALGPPIFLGQNWLPVLWDGEEDPDFFKEGCLEPATTPKVSKCATLENVIILLRAENPKKILPKGFDAAISYRGSYDELAFIPAENVTVGEMLKEAEGAVGAIFNGYKGGEYKMGLSTQVWIAKYGEEGETLGPTLLRLMLAQGKIPEE